MVRIKVVHVTTIDMAVRFLLLNQLLHLKGKGYAVSAVCSRGQWVSDIERAGIPVKTVEMKRRISPLSDLVALVKMFAHFKREGPAIVHTHTPKGGLLGQLAARFAGVPLILNTIHGFYFHQGMNPAARRFFVWLERIAALCSDSIFSQNREDIDTAIKEGICHRAKIKYLGNGVDITRFDPATISLEERLAKKRELGLSAQSKVVGIVGRLVREKGYLEFFQAARAVKKKIAKEKEIANRKEIANVKFLAIAPVEEGKKDRLDAAIISELGLDKDVILLGWRLDMPELYAIMDVVVLPSHREGFPRTLIEASAMGKPVVATNIRGCREVVEDRKTGLLVPVKDPQALAEAIVNLLEDEAKAEEMGRAGRRRAETLFDERKVFERVEEEYERLLRQKLGRRLPT